ncbi:MAG: hypothetical protein JRE40_02375 [Deltaproteobacteria bacterium]|nr:hypothetical protein [Deltaproteobacteria bacterium]
MKLTPEQCHALQDLLDAAQSVVNAVGSAEMVTLIESAQCIAMDLETLVELTQKLDWKMAEATDALCELYQGENCDMCSACPHVQSVEPE